MLLIILLLLLSSMEIVAQTSTLSVDFTTEDKVLSSGKSYRINGDEMVNIAGEKLLQFGSKTVLSLPVAGLLDTQGTLFVQFAMKPFAPFKASPRRPLLVIDAASAMQIGFSTGANINPPFVQFSFADGKDNMHFVKNDLSFEKIYTVAMSFDGDRVRCYLDGSLIHEAAQPEGVKSGIWRNLYVGPYKNGWTSVPPWDGDTLIKSIKIYDHALDSVDVARLSGLHTVPINERYSPVVSVLRTENRPDVEGFLPEEAWAHASGFYGMANLAKLEKSWNIPDEKTYFLHDEENLYLRFVDRIPAGVAIKSGHAPEDGENEVWGSESFELYFSNDGDLYRFGGCFAGGKCEMKNQDTSFNSPWLFRSTSSMQIDDSTRWVGEIVIPWSSIGCNGIPNEGIRFNFGRTWRLNDELVIAAPSYPMDGYGDIKAYPLLQAVDAVPNASIQHVGDPSYGILEDNVTLFSRENNSVRFSIIAESNAGLLVPTSLFQRVCQLKAGHEETLKVNVTLQQTEVDTLVYVLDSPDGKTVYQRQILPVKIAPEYLSVMPYFGQGRVQIHFRKSQFQAKYGMLQPELLLISPDGKILHTQKQIHEIMDCNFDIKGKAGLYRYELRDENGGILASCPFDFPGYGAWHGMGYDKKRIIPPFTPMTYVEHANGKTVSMWGRQYEFGLKDLFPTAVISQNASLLSEPMALLVGGENISSQAKAMFGMAEAHRFEYEVEAESLDCRVRGKGWVEFDGVSYYEMKINALHNTGKVQLVFTMPRSEAKYFHAAERPWGTKKTDFVQDGQLKLHYYPCLFVGTEERGISFFAESCHTWLTKDGSPLTLEADKDSLRIVLTLADSMSAGDSFDFEFGMVASPVKPQPKDYPFSIMDGYPEINRPNHRPTMDTSFTQWPSFQTHGDCLGDLPEKDNPLKIHYIKEIARLKSLNCKPVFYAMNMFLPDEYREVNANLSEWGVVPLNGFPYTKNGKTYYAQQLCACSDATDFYVWHLRQLLKDAKFSGIYFDFGGAPKCNNVQHGCHDRTTFLATREFLRRIALEFLDSGLQNYIIQLHNTDYVQLPAMTFATHLFNGEHIRQASSSLLHNGKDILDSYKLPMFACELNSMPWGLINNAYCPSDVLLPKYGGGKEQSELYVLRMTRAMMAGTLVHNSIMAAGRSHQGIFDKVVRIYDAFDVPNANFLGYYNTACPVTVEKGKDVYASAYRSANGKKWLLIVSHLGNERLDQLVKLHLDADKLGGIMPSTAVEKMDADDPEYQDTYTLRKQRAVPSYRMPLDYIPAGNRIISYQEGNLELELKYHTFALIVLE